MGKNVIGVFPIIAAIVSIWAFSGCTTYVGLKPVYPEAKAFSPVLVDSLQPTFKWEEPRPGGNVDLIIWESVDKNIRGDVVYYKENISGGAHHIEKSLQPNSLYFWSFRPTGTTGWSFTSFHYVIIMNTYVNYFLIKTPKQ